MEKLFLLTEVTMRENSTLPVILGTLLLFIMSSDPGLCKTNPNVLVASISQPNNATTTVFTAGGPTAPGYMLDGSNQWTDFPSLSITFFLEDTRAVMTSFRIAMFGDYGILVTRLVVDGGIVSKTLTGDEAFWSNSNEWFGTLCAGQHTIKVQYRANKSVYSNPVGTDLNERTLQVMVFGEVNISSPTVLTAGGPDATAYDLSGTNNWTDFPDLSLTFSLAETTPVIASFRIALYSEYGILVTRLMVDGQIVSKTITGAEAFWSNSNQWLGTLGSGQHTIKVQYRTDTSAHSNPVGTDLNDRTLQLMILGSTN